MSAEPFPGIYRAALLVAVDNGGINRFRSTETQAREYRQWLARQPQELLPAIDAYFLALSDDDLFEFCCGGEGEPQVDALRKAAPPFADQLLNSYFEEVC